MNIQETNTLIESLGVYLPSTRLTTEEVLQGCANPIDFQLEAFTGIKSRRVVGENEYSFDLAYKAARQCLERSAWSAADVDMVLCCNISRRDGANFITYEPSTAVTLAKALDIRNAITFDVNNACAGMFTGILVARAYLSLGLIRNAMVVSGEHISHILRVAQREVTGFLDPRMPCLTLGDAGAAMMLENSDHPEKGMRDLELYTVGAHSNLCVAKVSSKTPGLPVMHTDAVALSTASIKHGVEHASFIQRRRDYPMDNLDHMIPHQTAKTSIVASIKATNRHHGRVVLRAKQVFMNLEERGNTASTSHAVALFDGIQDGRVGSNQNILFVIGASGLTVGTGVYTLDDLPDRMLGNKPTTPRSTPLHVPAAKLERKPGSYSGVGFVALGFAEAAQPECDSVVMSTEAGTRALEQWGKDRNDIGLLVNVGVYRSEYLSEPAVAAMLAGELHLNDTIQADSPRKTLAFDLLNGALGFLNACEFGVRYIEAGRSDAVLISASEVENNLPDRAFPLMGLKQAASATVLERSGRGDAGFGRFVFKSFPEYADCVTARAESSPDYQEAFVRWHRAPGWPSCLIECVPVAVRELLELEQLEAAAMSVIVIQQLPGAVINALAERLGVPRDRFVDASDETGDWFTSALPRAMARVQQLGMSTSGSIALLIGVGSGVQVGCATYRFD
jgi:3-oxoacyl-[acyl-carrier-protein] synthase III